MANRSRERSRERFHLSRELLEPVQKNVQENAEGPGEYSRNIPQERSGALSREKFTRKSTRKPTIMFTRTFGSDDHEAVRDNIQHIQDNL